jgi:hypothetical protein
MTNDEKIQVVKTMIGSDDDDLVLLTYLNIAGSKILSRAYPYDNTVTEVPARYELLQCEIAAYLLNKRGAEGQTAHSENGINRTYENADIPPSMLNAIVPHCGTFRGDNT